MASEEGAQVTAGTAEASTVEQAGEVRLTRLESLRGIGVCGVLLGHTWLIGWRADALNAQAMGDTARTLELAGRATGANHFWERLFVSGGFGLMLFFALSGYLLFWPFAQRWWGKGGSLDLATYARNRAIRILPLYYAAVVVCLIVVEKGGTLGQWWRFLFFMENFSQYTIKTVNGPLWSLVVELQFYLLLPFIAYGLGRVSRGNRWVGAGLLALFAAVSFALHYRYVASPYDRQIHPRWEGTVVTQFGFLAVGMLVAILRTAWRHEVPSWVRGVARRADFWLVLAFGTWVIGAYNYQYQMITALGAAFIVAACVLPLKPGILLRALDWRWLAWLGITSYSFYVWHFPILRFLDGTLDSFPKIFFIGGPITLIVATLSYKVIEEPFLRLRKRWSPDAPAHTQHVADGAPSAPAPAAPAS